MDGTVLIADDDRTIRTVLTQALTRAGCKVHATSSLTMLMRWVAEGRGDAVICDVVMPDGNGLELLPKIHEDRPGLPVIVISAQNTIMTAIRANEADAFDYLSKPFDLPDLMKRTAQALKSSGAPATREVAPEESPGETLPLIGTSPVMQELFRLIAQVMSSDYPVLIKGASGTGKSLIAEVLHDFSPRRSLPRITLTPDAPFTADDAVRRARGGTIVIEDLTRFDALAQAQLLLLADRNEAPAPRLIATAEGDVADAMTQGILRQDLFYRLSALNITTPQLADRVDDIIPLAQHFLSLANPSAPKTLSSEAASALRLAPWPGNVRQLENVIHALSLTEQSDVISGAAMSRALADHPGMRPCAAVTSLGQEKLSEAVERHLRRYFDLHDEGLPPAGVYARILREIELPLIEVALDATSGNQIKCAELLGINRNTLRKKISDLDIHVTRRRKMM